MSETPTQQPEFSSAAIRLLELLHCPTAYEVEKQEALGSDLSVLYQLREADPSSLPERLTSLVNQLFDLEDASEQQETLSSELESLEGEAKASLEKAILARMLADLERTCEELLIAYAEIQDLRFIEEVTGETITNLEKVETLGNRIGEIVEKIVDFQLVSNAISSILMLIIHDLKSKCTSGLAGLAWSILNCYTERHIDFVHHKGMQLPLVRNTIHTQQSLIGTRNEVRPPTLEDILLMAEPMGARFGYRVEISDKPKNIQEVPEGVINIHIEEEALSSIKLDIALLGNILQQTIKNTARIQKIKASDKLKKETGYHEVKAVKTLIEDHESPLKIIERLEKTSISVSITHDKTTNTIKLQIADSCIGIGYDQILDLMRKEIPTLKPASEEGKPDLSRLSTVEKMIMDPEGVNHVPPIALQQQLIARGRSMTMGGTGLGLSAVSLFAQLNGGFLTVGNQNLVNGAVMSLTFPVGGVTPLDERSTRIVDFNALADRILPVDELGQPLDPKMVEGSRPECIIYDEDHQVLLAVYEAAEIRKITARTGIATRNTALAA